MKHKKWRILLYGIILGCLLLRPEFVSAEADGETLNLRQTIEAALQANLELQRSKDEIDAATANKDAATTEFFPTLNARYGYIRRDNPTTQALGTQGGQIVDVVVNPEDEYNFVTSFSQPIFTGFALYNRYKIADLGLDIAEFSERLTRQNVILDAKNAYYLIL